MQNPLTNEFNWSRIENYLESWNSLADSMVRFVNVSKYTCYGSIAATGKRNTQVRRINRWSRRNYPISSSSAQLRFQALPLSTLQTGFSQFTAFVNIISPFSISDVYTDSACLWSLLRLVRFSVVSISIADTVTSTIRWFKKGHRRRWINGSRYRSDFVILQTTSCITASRSSIEACNVLSWVILCTTVSN